MRVIEPPSKAKRMATKTKKRKRHPVRTIGAISVLIASSFVLLLVAERFRQSALLRTGQVDDLAVSDSQSADHVAGVQDAALKYFTGDQFQELYESLPYPNSQLPILPIAITGNVPADNRIRAIAKSRGYTEQTLPVLPLTRTASGTSKQKIYLQPKAYDAWRELEEAAKQYGVQIVLKRGFVDFAEQTKLFMNELQKRGVSTGQIASGSADDRIVSALQAVSAPGYSLHQTGYAITLGCGDEESVTQSRCLSWLSDNNYANAKRAGWVPAYTSDATNQGAKSEAFDLMWVGKEQVRKL